MGFLGWVSFWKKVLQNDFDEQSYSFTLWNLKILSKWKHEASLLSLPKKYWGIVPPNKTFAAFYWKILLSSHFTFFLIPSTHKHILNFLKTQPDDTNHKLDYLVFLFQLKTFHAAMMRRKLNKIQRTHTKYLNSNNKSVFSKASAGGLVLMVSS